MNNQKILIIGAAGFVGSNLTRHILTFNKGYSVVGVDRIDYLSNMNNAYMNKNQFYIADVNDYRTLSVIYEIEKPDIIIYAASSEMDCLHLLGQYFVDSTKGFCNVLNMHLYNKNPNKKFIYISPAIYSEDNVEPITENGVVDVNDITDIITTTSENLLIGMSKSFECNGTVIRCPEIFGARDKTSIVSEYFRKINGNKEIHLSNHGAAIKDLLYIEDFCNGVMTIVENENANDKIYNLSANCEFSEIEIVNMIIESMEKNNDETIICFDDNKPSVNSKSINSSKIRDLGWKPKRKFKDNIKYTINWFTNNKWFFI